jgi:uncharacterized protein
MAGPREVAIHLEERGAVSGLLAIPPAPRAMLVLGHGAGAGMRHPFMARIADGLADRDVATLRYQFPYMEAGRKAPDRPSVAVDTIVAAVAAARHHAPALPVFAGGKSFGGRMTARAVADAGLTVQGLVFLGFPLHAPGRPSVDRAAHLSSITLPMLFVQGTRDKLADLSLLRPVIDTLHHATLHIVDGGDHSFGVLKRSGRTEEAVMAEVCDVVAGWVGG